MPASNHLLGPSLVQSLIVVTQTTPIHLSRLNSISLQACNPTLSYQLQAKQQTYPKYSQDLTLPAQLSLGEKHED